MDDLDPILRDLILEVYNDVGEEPRPHEPIGLAGARLLRALFIETGILPSQPYEVYDDARILDDLLPVWNPGVRPGSNEPDVTPTA